MADVEIGVVTQVDPLLVRPRGFESEIPARDMVGALQVDDEVTIQRTALRAYVTSRLGGAGGGAEVPEGGWTQEDLAEDSVGAPQLQTDSVERDKILAGAIDDVRLAQEAVTEVKIATDAITETKISDGAITTPKMTAGSIDGDRITAGTLDADRITAFSITGQQIQGESITADKISANWLEGDNLLIDGTATFASGYDPSGAAQAPKSVNPPENPEDGDLWRRLVVGKVVFNYYGPEPSADEQAFIDHLRDRGIAVETANDIQIYDWGFDSETLVILRSPEGAYEQHSDERIGDLDAPGGIITMSRYDARNAFDMAGSSSSGSSQAFEAWLDPHPIHAGAQPTDVENLYTSSDDYEYIGSLESGHYARWVEDGSSDSRSAVVDDDYLDPNIIFFGLWKATSLSSKGWDVFDAVVDQLLVTTTPRFEGLYAYKDGEWKRTDPDDVDFSLLAEPGTTVINGENIITGKIVSSTGAWEIDLDGNATFNEGTFKGAIEGASINIGDSTTSLEVSSSGQVMMRRPEIRSTLYLGDHSIKPGSGSLEFLIEGSNQIVDFRVSNDNLTVNDTRVSLEGHTHNYAPSSHTHNYAPSSHGDANHSTEYARVSGQTPSDIGNSNDTGGGTRWASERGHTHRLYVGSNSNLIVNTLSTQLGTSRTEHTDFRTEVGSSNDATIRSFAVRYYTSAASTTAVRMTSAGNMTYGTSTARVKDTIEPIWKSHYDSVLKITPRYYRSKAKADREDWSHYGFIAEEVAEVDPRLAIWSPKDMEDFFEKYPEEDKAQVPLEEMEPVAVDTDKLLALLYCVVQEQAEEIKELKKHTGVQLDAGDKELNGDKGENNE